MYRSNRHASAFPLFPGKIQVVPLDVSISDDVRPASLVFGMQAIPRPGGWVRSSARAETLATSNRRDHPDQEDTPTMHTMSFNPRLWLLPIAFLGLGCASTGGFGRPSEDMKPRTIASIGDRPISATTGSPDSSAIASLDTTDRNRSGRDLISGRVVDDRGEPVPNARVRIADGGLLGGRVVSAKTDRGGGFTLHGLRPGSTYTVIAEYEGLDGLVEGRSEAKSPKTDVEIALQVDDQPIDRRRAAKPPASRTISDRQSVDETDEGDQPLRLNHEDTPAAGDVEDIDDLAGKTSMRTRSGAIPVSSWRAIEPKHAAKASTVASSADGDRAARRVSTRNVVVSGDEPEPRSSVSRDDQASPVVDDLDEDENPLPPAIEPEAGRTRGARAEPDGDDPPRRPKSSKRISKAQTKSPGQTPGALVLAKEETSTPIKPRHVAEPRLDPEPPPADAAELIPIPDPFATNTPRQTTFGDLAHVWKALPKSEPASITPAPLARGKGSRKAAAALPNIETCRYDSKKRQLIDFRLPDLDGNPVNLKDLEGDLILLDFWGTWCQPCLSSVPHLVELQERLGGKRLTIVGIACEEGPASASAAHVAKVANQLGINYTVLVSSKDERSPVLEALNVQAFPTMVVIDRTGRIVWRDQGATEMTLARLDRAVDPVARTVGDRVRR
jgi:thiol-disulfide isomerase/thioredoxin